MRKWTIPVVFVLVAAVAESAVPASPGWSRLRCLSSYSLALATSAVEQSPVVGEFIAELERSDVVVYLEVLTSPSASGLRGAMTFVTAAAGIRYLLVQIDGYRSLQLDQIAVLGHELWHALEVARAADVTDLASFRRHFGQVGHAWGRNSYETDEARAAERRVRDDACGRPKAVPRGPVAGSVEDRVFSRSSPLVPGPTGLGPISERPL